MCEHLVRYNVILTAQHRFIASSGDGRSARAEVHMAVSFDMTNDDVQELVL